MEYQKSCNTGLSLDLGLANYSTPTKEKEKQKQKVDKTAVCFDMALQILPKQENGDEDLKAEKDGNHNNGCRKKLRRTKEQSALLEESFKLNSTLNTIQKHSLAEKLNLSPRQVEVWFQNRRARTKLKQTELDCDFLKKCCDKLVSENSRLKQELESLHALPVGPSSFCIQLPKAATLTMCSSCDNLVNVTFKGTLMAEALFTEGEKKTQSQE